MGAPSCSWNSQLTRPSRFPTQTSRSDLLPRAKSISLASGPAISQQITRGSRAKMKIAEGKIRLAATDLGSHLACRHLTTLDLQVAQGKRTEPDWAAPDLA